MNITETIQRDTEEAERRVQQAVADRSEKLSLAGLRIERLPSALRAAKNLLELDLTSTHILVGLEPLDALSNLRSLQLAWSGVHDLSPLSGLRSLRSLGLMECLELSNLEPLRSLQSLQMLDLSLCASVWDLRPLESLTNLLFLYLNSWNEVDDLGPLSSLNSLVHLDLSGCLAIEDIRPIASLPSLQCLHMSYVKPGLDLRPLQTLPTLKEFEALQVPLDCAPGAAPLCGWGLLTDLYADCLLGPPESVGSEDEYDNCLERVRTWQAAQR
jgi:Leucine-rich repeat (LRR) protein